MMKLVVKCAALGMVLAVTMSAPVSAQNSGTLVAVVDIVKIFDQYPRFQAQMDAIKKQISAFDAQMQAEQTALSKQGEALKDLRPGSTEYKQTEEIVAQKIGDLRVRAQLKKKEILEQETQLYFETYNATLGQVRAICDRHKIGIVFRYDSAPIDPSDRASVLKGVNRPIIFQQRLDITKMVLDSLPR